MTAHQQWWQTIVGSAELPPGPDWQDYFDYPSFYNHWTWSGNGSSSIYTINATGGFDGGPAGVQNDNLSPPYASANKFASTNINPGNVATSRIRWQYKAPAVIGSTPGGQLGFIDAGNSFIISVRSSSSGVMAAQYGVTTFNFAATIANHWYQIEWLVDGVNDPQVTITDLTAGTSPVTHVFTGDIKIKPVIDQVVYNSNNSLSTRIARIEGYA